MIQITDKNGNLLHIIVRKEDIKKGRKDVISPDQFLQCALLNLDKGKTFQPHKHIWKEGYDKVIAQESWCVIQGSVKVMFYNLEDELIFEDVLKAGDASFTLYGGHNYEILEDDTLVYEYKCTRYEGVEKDKTFI